MSRYDLYLLLHIVAVVVWVGGGFLATLLTIQSAVSDERLRRTFIAFGDLGRLFGPAAMVLLAMGILMIVDGPWSFEELWIVLGLAGWLVAVVVGAAATGPIFKRLGEEAERTGTLSPAALGDLRRALILQRIDLAVLFLVVADMVIKPEGDDAGVLLAMAAVLVATLVYVMVKLRTLPRVAA